jgi:hypothetical protein
MLLSHTLQIQHTETSVDTLCDIFLVTFGTPRWFYIHRPSSGEASVLPAASLGVMPLASHSGRHRLLELPTQAAQWDMPHPHSLFHIEAAGQWLFLLLHIDFTLNSTFSSRALRYPVFCRDWFFRKQEEESKGTWTSGR